MSDGDDSFSLLGVTDTAERAVARTRSVLGVAFGVFPCPDCGRACQADTAYDARRAAFHNGDCPTWYCEHCEKHFVRETSDADTLTGDMYGRGGDTK